LCCLTTVIDLSSQGIVYIYYQEVMYVKSTIALTDMTFIQHCRLSFKV